MFDLILVWIFRRLKKRTALWIGLFNVKWFHIHFWYATQLKKRNVKNKLHFLFVLRIGMTLVLHASVCNSIWKKMECGRRLNVEKQLK